MNEVYSFILRAEKREMGFFVCYQTQNEVSKSTFVLFLNER